MSEPFPSRLQLPPGPWPTLLDGLCARFPAIDAGQWRDRLARGRVRDAQGHPLAADAPWVAGMEITYFREVAQEPVVPGVESVVHQDAHLVVADKPPFLPVTPGGGFVEQCLLRRLSRRLDLPELVPLHRIDRATSGLVLFSVDPRSRGTYQRLFAERAMRKRYLALAPPLSALDFPYVHRSRLAPGDPFFLMREVPGEANSETRIEVVERSRHHWTYRLEPVTGRKHQLRVHMAALGAPLLNDPFYPELPPETEDDHARPLALLAHSLEFTDPVSGEPRRFESGRSLG